MVLNVSIAPALNIICAFRRIRKAIPTTSGRSFRSIRTSWRVAV